MGGRVNDGRSENITIEFDSDVSEESWTEFLARLKELEDEWSHVTEFSSLWRAVWGEDGLENKPDNGAMN